MGQVTKDWLKFRKQWVKDNPPNHEGYWICGICNGWVQKWEMELDHILNRSTHPHLRLDPNNIQPVHPSCNRKKKNG